MPDHIPEFDPFMSEAEDVPMLPPSEIRRRGDRRRAIRRTSLATGSLALAVIAGFSFAQSPLMTMGPKLPNIAQPATPTPSASPSESPSPEESESPTPDPSPSPTAEPTPTPVETPPEPSTDAPKPTGTQATSSEPSVSVTPSPSAEETTVTTAPTTDPEATSAAPTTAEPPSTVSSASFPDGSIFGSGMAQIESGEGLGQAALSPCETGDFGAYTTAWTAIYAYPNTDDSYFVGERVFQYESADDAQAAFVQLQGQTAMCTDPNGDTLEMSDDGQSEIAASIDLEKLGTDDVSMSYSEGIWALTEPAGEGVFLTHMAVRVDDRLAVIVEQLQSNEKHCSPTTGDIVDQCSVPAAVNEIAQALQN